MKVINALRPIALGVALCAAPIIKTPAFYSNERMSVDTFEYTTPVELDGEVSNCLDFPSPRVSIAGEEKNAVIVIDLSKNILYKYDSDGIPETSYSVASGKKSSPTKKGVRVVTHVESYPYRTAYGTKRRRNPKAYGPNVICLNMIDTKTGAQSQTGQFIHGNNDPSSIGKYASLGCIRMDNEVIKQLSKQVKQGDIVIMQ